MAATGSRRKEIAFKDYREGNITEGEARRIIGNDWTEVQAAYALDKGTKASVEANPGKSLR